METKPIQLHLGKCIEDLDNLFAVPDLKQKKVRLLCNSALKLFEKAEKAREKGDEESSYVFYMKYLQVVTYLRQDPEYLKEKKFYNELLGVKNPTKAITLAEKLKFSLIDRYAETSIAKRENKNESDQHSIIYEQNMMDAEQIVPAPVIANDGLPSSEDVVIKCIDLFRLIKESRYKIMILDIRSLTDYESSHINHPLCVSVPGQFITAGKSAYVLEQDLPEFSKSVWRDRQSMDLIVMLDWSSRSVIPGHPLYLLKTIFLKWDVNVQYKRSPVALEGGFEEWLLLYPSFTTNPNVLPPMQNDLITDMLDDIHYPSWKDISPIRINSPVNLSIGSSVKPYDYGGNPVVDRSSKAAAVQTYEERARHVQGLLEQQEKLADTSLHIEMQRIKAEQDWEEIRVQTEEQNEDASKANFELREQEILSQLMFLESKQHDMELENQNLREQLEEYQRREKEESEKRKNTQHIDKMEVTESSVLDPNAALDTSMELEASKRRIKDARRKRDALHRQRELLEEQRHRKITRERRMRKTTMEQEDEDVENRDPRDATAALNRSRSSPNIAKIDDEDEVTVPKIDRGLKPVAVDHNSYHRDFDPLFGTVGRGLTGLKNLGNTCYMNSIIQCLNNTSILSTYFCNGKYREHLNKSSGTRGVIAEELAAVFRALWSGEYKYITAKDLRQAVGRFHSSFRGCEQQDSHEFLTILMDWLHGDLQFTIKPPNKDNLHPSDKAWLDFNKCRESLILRLFYGQMKSTVKCVVCGETSVTYDTFSNLSLELPPNANRCTLYDCLRLYLQGERVPGWDCPKCREKRDAVKKLDISRLPPVLVIHFKRFYADADDYGSGNMYRKKQTYIDFPLEGLELGSLALDQNRTPYQLYAVSNHYGSMQAGHYTAYCESSAYGKWYKFDDHSVMEIPAGEVKSSAAYLLFYSTHHAAQS